MLVSTKWLSWLESISRTQKSRRPGGRQRGRRCLISAENVTMNEHRIPPLRATYDKNAPFGICKWCAKELPRNKNGSISRKTRWHGDCAAEYMLLTDYQTIIQAVFRRDHGICAKCQDPGKLVRRYMGIARENSDGSWSISATFNYGTENATAIMWRHIWEADHIVPLWQVKHLPDEERVKFFHLDNIQTLCKSCHAAKTTYEAGMRAHGRCDETLEMFTLPTTE